MSNEFNTALEHVIGDLLERADKERKKEKPYKDLWNASENGLTSLLSESEHQMTHIALNLASVIREKFGLKTISNRLWDLIRALPLAMAKLGDEIQHTEGNSCCHDKAREIYYQEVLSEIKKIKEAV